MATAISEGDSASTRFGKLLPAEVTGLYVSVRALFMDGSENNPNNHFGVILIILAGMCLALSIIYIWKVRKVTNIYHLGFYAITFVIWALTLDPDRLAALLPPDIGIYMSKAATALSLLWAFAVAMLVPNSLVSSGDQNQPPVQALPVAPNNNGPV